jgi:transcriptional regulator with XRE-family HTH domain
MNEQQQVFSIGPLMKAARKFKKFNQADVAQAIGCSQSALSKMEHNLLVPSAPQWFLFARFTSIPPETLETGVIDRHSKVKFNNDQVSLGFKIPKKYRHFRAEKVREIFPFLQFLEKKMTPPMNKEFMLSTGLDPEFFLDFDNLISFQLFLDTIQYFITLGKNTPEAIKGIVNFGQNDVYWNHYGVEWKKLDSISAVLTEFAQEQIFFQTDFQLKVETATGKTTVSYFPEYHLKQMANNVSPEVVQFLNSYREASLENLIDRVLGQKVKVELIPEVSTSALGARFEVKAAA